MLRLQYKIIVSLWIKLFDERAALSLATMLDKVTEIGAPSPEIIIHINHGNSGRFGSSLQSCNAVSQGWNETGQLFRLGEIEIVNYVPQGSGRPQICRERCHADQHSYGAKIFVESRAA